MISTNDWLPIGSVVHIEGCGDDLVMITSCMVGIEGEDTLWDYAGVPYPEGVTGPDKDIMFNKDSIDGVFHIGYQDPDAERYQDALRSIEDDFNARKREAAARL